VSDDQAFPTLSAGMIDIARRYGTETTIAAGEFAFVEGQLSYDLVVIVDGTFSILARDRAAHGAERVVTTHESGRFLGELSILTGERTTLAARAERDSLVIRIDPPALRHLMAAETDLSDILFAAFVARREALRGGADDTAIRIIGSRYSASALALRSFARRRRLAHTFLDLDDPGIDGIDVLLTSLGVRRVDTPVVITPTAVLRNPTVGELAEHLGVTYRPVAGKVYDVVVVGAGPGGLAAAVYGASEGLDTLVLDGVGSGGQAGTSSRIENFFGFPAGVSGGELVEQGALQATRLGAAINAPCTVVALRLAGDGFAVTLADGTDIPCRAVVIATGVQYRQLPLGRLDEFEGAGVYYAATDLEARVCAGQPVTVVGGGNSAGQAAIYLAHGGCNVTIVIRGDDLTASMSNYLIDRIDAAPNITVLSRTQVVELHGTRSLSGITIESEQHADGVAAQTSRRQMPCSGMFSFIGAAPFTNWLASVVELDGHGFVVTDRDVTTLACTGLELLPFETSQPGVFAIGDVRHGSMKRVAAAVGEGSSAIRSVHEHLARSRVTH